MYDYTTVSRMVASYPYIGSLTTVTSAMFAVCIQDAEAIINAKLSNLYDVPVAGSPSVLQTIATNMAVYSVLVKFMTTQGTLTDHPWHGIYKDTISLLDKLASGDVALVNSAGTILQGTAENAQVWSNTMNYQPTFADGISMEQSHVDPDKIDDDEGARDL